MSKSILERLFDGEIYPSEQIKPSSPEYKEVVREIDEIENYFLNSLSESDCERFGKLRGLHEKIQSVYAYEDFAHGYKLGVRLTCEAFTDMKETAPEKE